MRLSESEALNTSKTSRSLHGFLPLSLLITLPPSSICSPYPFIPPFPPPPGLSLLSLLQMTIPLHLPQNSTAPNALRQKNINRGRFSIFLFFFITTEHIKEHQLEMIANFLSATTSLASKAITATISTVVHSAASAAEILNDISQMNSNVAEAVTFILDVPGTYDAFDFESYVFHDFVEASPEAQLPMPGSFPNHSPDRSPVNSPIDEMPISSRRSPRPSDEWQTIEARKSPRRDSPCFPVAPAPPADILEFRSVRQKTHGRYRQPVPDMESRLTQGNIFLVLQEC